MTDPVFGLIAVALLFTLLVAMLIPAPSRPVEDGAGVGLGLIVGGCAAALVMGVLALAGLTIASAVLGAVAWLLVMPCVWMARAPQAAGGWYEEEEDDDGDDGGSPSPDAPAAPPVPSDDLPGLRPTATQPAAVTWTPAPRPVPVMGLAARVQQMLAAEEAQRMLAAQEVQRIVASAPPVALPPAVAVPAVAPVVEPALAAAPVPQPEPGEPRTRPAARVREDTRPVGHVLGAAAHARTRRRAAARDRRSDEARRD